VFIVDKEPHGMRGEVLETLVALKERGTQLVLGLRDILDDPVLLAPEWQNKNVLPTLENLYDEIWIYGLPQVSNPLAGLNLPAKVARKTVYTGYLRRRLRSNSLPLAELPFGNKPYILVTAGGGGDGEQVFDWALRAYENDPAQPVPAFFVFGPFLDPDLQSQFNVRMARLDNVASITFDNHPEAFISNASGIVAMGGYNTFCEILSFDKPALIVPRTRPRLEQYLRASRMQEMGLVKMLMPDSPEILENPQEDWKIMATALRHLPQQSVPSEVVVPGLLDGLRNVNRLVDMAAGRRREKMRVIGRAAGSRHAGQY
jgi:predicted glycosyltransferase